MTKIEEVAMAMNRRARYKKDDDRNYYVDNWLEIARAAVEAMREPTRAMCDAGDATAEYWDCLDADTTWIAMIDAILAEKP